MLSVKLICGYMPIIVRKINLGIFFPNHHMECIVYIKNGNIIISLKTGGVLKQNRLRQSNLDVSAFMQDKKQKNDE